jgi:hypothetical protein
MTCLYQRLPRTGSAFRRRRPTTRSSQSSGGSNACAPPAPGTSPHRES